MQSARVVAVVSTAALTLAASNSMAAAQGRPHYRTYAMGDSLQAVSQPSWQTTRRQNVASFVP